MEFPFQSIDPIYGTVPKTIKENLEFRKQLFQKVLNSPADAEAAATLCKRSLLFFVNAFVWIYEPRDAKVLPFITYEFQDDVFTEIDKAIGSHDLSLPKSRDQGLTWMVLTTFSRRLLFFNYQTFCVVSRKEGLVDGPGNDPDRLFWKLDHIHKFMPEPFKKHIVRQKLSIENTANGSNIIGASTTGEIGRGGRKLAIMLDEFAAFETADGYDALASTQHNTRSRIFPSTPRGIGNAFYDVCHGHLKRIDIHWSKHPIQSRGLYRAKDGEVTFLDDAWQTPNPLTVGQILKHFPQIKLKEEYTFESEVAEPYYPFTHDGKLRSPHYDNEEARAPSLQWLSQEMDINFLGSGAPFFDTSMIVRLVEKTAREPHQIGELSYDDDGTPRGFFGSETGRLKLWLNLDAGRPPRDRSYVLGVDVSTGSGASNSCVSVVDVKTREKVAMLVTPYLRPEKLAVYAAALGKWFNNAEIIFEGQGAGGDFGACLDDLKYPALFYHVKSSGSRTLKPGWFSTKDGKRNLLTEYGRALASGEFLNRDKLALQECLQYNWTSTGDLAHVEESKVDPSGAKANHGDRVIADALAWMAVRERVGGRIGLKKERPAIAPVRSIAYRDQLEEEEQEDDW